MEWGERNIQETINGYFAKIYITLQIIVMMCVSLLNHVIID